ncbi:hypothetical protein FQR65_LT08763 [Abscondita terminalis]|nr:hypothetical protein FQR65_LT08763 [Abscondita terminalis]
MGRGKEEMGNGEARAGGQSDQHREGNGKARKKKRKSNMVIKGPVKMDQTIMEAAKQIIKEKIGVNVEVKEAYVVGKRAEKSAIVVKLGSWEEKREVMKEKNKLRGTKVFIDDDQTRKKREMQEAIRTEARRQEKEGRRVRVGHGKAGLTKAILHGVILSSRDAVVIDMVRNSLKKYLNNQLSNPLSNYNFTSDTVLYRSTMEKTKQGEFSALLHLVKSVIGSGILSLPIAFKCAGLIMGTVGLVITATICLYCTYLIIESSNYLNKATGSTISSFAEVAGASCRCGPKWAHKYENFLKNLMNGGIFLGYYACLSIYTVIISMNLEKIVTFYWKPIDIRLYMAILFIPLLLISYVPNWKRLAVVSMITNIFLMSGVTITMYYLIKALPSQEEKELIADVETLPTFFSIVIFSMQTIGAALPLKNSMKDPTKFLGYFGVFNKSGIIIVSLYFLVGFLGYFCYGSNTKENITLNLPSDSYAAQAVQLLITLSVLGAYGVQFFVTLEILWEAIEKRLTKRRKLINYILRTLMVLVAVLVAIAVPTIVPFVSLMSAICFSTVGIIIPVIVHMLTFWDEAFNNYFIIAKYIVIIIFGILACIFGTTTAIIDIIALNK